MFSRKLSKITYLNREYKTRCIQHTETDILESAVQDLRKAAVRFRPSVTNSQKYSLIRQENSTCISEKKTLEVETIPLFQIFCFCITPFPFRVTFYLLILPHDLVKVAGGGRGLKIFGT